MSRIRATLDIKPEGTPGQVPAVNAAGTALEYVNQSGGTTPLLADDGSGAPITDETSGEWLFPD